MTSNNRLKNMILAAFVAGAGLISTGPVYAAQADIDLLKSYVGNWKGRGTTTAAGSTETVVCKLDISESDQTKINYKGRCSLAGGNLSIAGTMGFINERNRFEAVMSSNTAFSGVAIGKRRGKGIDFNLKSRDKETGADYTVDADMSLKASGIEIEFSVTNLANGNKIVATVPFEK